MHLVYWWRVYKIWYHCSSNILCRCNLTRMCMKSLFKESRGSFIWSRVYIWRSHFLERVLRRGLSSFGLWFCFLFLAVHEGMEPLFEHSFMQMHPNACRMLESHCWKKKGVFWVIIWFYIIGARMTSWDIFCAMSLYADHYTSLLVGSDSLK